MTSYVTPLPFVLLNLESAETNGKNYKNLNISRTKRAFAGWTAIFETKIQEQFKNISETYQYFSRTQATLKIL